MRYTGELRVRFRGDPALAKVRLARGRLIVGQLLNGMNLGRDVQNTGQRERSDPDGTVYRVIKTYRSVPILEIDVTGVSGGELVETLSGFVVRPSVHADFNEFGPDAYTIIRPTNDVGAGNRWCFNKAYADLFNGEDAYGDRWFYSEQWPEDPDSEADGIRWMGNVDWHSEGQSIVLSWLGPSNRYFGSDASLDYWTQVYHKGAVLFDTTVHLAGSPAADERPELFAGAVKLRVMGAFVTPQADGLHLVVMLYGINDGSFASTQVRHKEYVLSARLRIDRIPSTPDKVNALAAPRLKVDPADVVLRDFLDWRNDPLDPSVDWGPDLEGFGHPLVANASGTEARRITTSFDLSALSGGHLVVERVFRVENLDDFESSYTIHRYTDPSEPDVTTFEGFANPYPPDEWGTEELYGGPFVITKEERAYSFTNNQPNIIAVDYKGDVPVYAYAQDNDGVQFSSVSTRTVQASNVVVGSSSSLPEADFDTTASLVRTQSQGRLFLRTDFFEKTGTSSESYSEDKTTSFHVVVFTSRTVSDYSESVTVNEDVTVGFDLFHVVYLDLRYDMLVTANRPFQSTIRTFDVYMQGQRVATTTVEES